MISTSSSLALRGTLGRAGDPLDAAPGSFCGLLVPPVPAARVGLGPSLHGQAA